jgi:hypothetical protein
MIDLLQNMFEFQLRLDTSKSSQLLLHSVPRLLEGHFQQKLLLKESKFLN